MALPVASGRLYRDGAMDPCAEIHDALGDDAASVLPPLLALRTVTVRLPEYIVRTLEAVAAEECTTVDAALGFELIEFAGMHLSRLEGSIPGFRRAYLFPGPGSDVDLGTMKPKTPKQPRDVITNAHRVFGELIERSEQPPRRGNIRRAGADSRPATKTKSK